MNLKDLLSTELYDQVQAKIDEVNAGQPDKTKHVRFADLSEGRYVSVDKFNSQTGALNQQIADLTAQITQRDSDLADLNSRLTSTQSDAEATLADTRQQLSTLQNQYDADKQSWADELARARYESAVRERANQIKFSSPAAQRDFVRSVTEKKLQMDEDTLLGYDDFLAKYTADNPGAIVADNDPEPTPTPPTITLPTTKPGAVGENIFGFHFGGVRPHPTEE